MNVLGTSKAQQCPADSHETRRVNDGAIIERDRSFPRGIHTIPFMRWMTLSIMLFATGFGVPDRGFAATMRLKAVAIDDSWLQPTDRIWVMPNEIVTVEAYVTGWDEDAPNSRLISFDFVIDGITSYFSGESGRLIQRGEDAPAGLPCQSDVDCAHSGLQCVEGMNYPSFSLCGYGCVSGLNCPAEFPVCTADQRCVGEEHHPEDFAFIDETRADFVHYGHALFPNELEGSGNINLQFTSATLDGQGPRDNGTDWYIGEFDLVASADACGEFTVGISYGEAVLATSPYQFISPDLEPLTIVVVCPPVMGACCVPRQSCVDRTKVDCQTRNGTWQEGQLCSTGTQVCARRPSPGQSGPNPPTGTNPTMISNPGVQHPSE